ncbi:MAG: tetratricopeptide repeat protein [Acidobacteriia bacterium]|nr:tetratricopeptide repeat protein [Terriglobia bacterium]
MRLLRLTAPLVFLALSLAAFAQDPVPNGQTLVVIPFENQSKAPGLEWIGESFPELLQERLTSSSMYVLTRTDRIRAYERLGIPSDVHPSRATIYRMAEQMDVDYVLLGSYGFDGRTFSSAARILDMRQDRLWPEVREAGPLVELIDIQTALAWDVLHQLHPEWATTRQAYVASAPAVRLDAFENYVRGILAATEVERIRRFSEAALLNPAYPEALLQLGKVYYRERQYDQAVASLARVAQDAPEAREANFYLGLAAYYQGSYERAETAFGFVAARLPLAEVYNNLGVATSRRGKKGAAEFFQRAVDADPSDADYRFNLGVALYRAGDLAGASRLLREALSLRPGDAEAKSLLDSVASNAISRAQGNGLAKGRTPLERIRINYEESSFRQLVLKLDAAAEQRLAKDDPRVHARFHADRGHELLAQGFVAEAEREFRESVTLDPSNAEAHAGLAQVLEAKQDVAGARVEAEAALRLRQFAEPLLVLARLDLRDNRTETAAENVDRALRLEPSNAQALALKRAVAAKLAEKAQPLPNR